MFPRNENRNEGTFAKTREENSMDQYRSRLKLSENFERHWSIPFPGEIHMDQSLVHTFSWGNSYGPMVLKVLLKFPPTLVLVHGWLFPENHPFTKPPFYLPVSLLLTDGSFLLTIELLCLQWCLGASLLTIGEKTYYRVRPPNPVPKGASRTKFTTDSKLTIRTQFATAIVKHYGGHFETTIFKEGN